MNWSWLDQWLGGAPLAWFSLAVFVILILAAAIGAVVRRLEDRRRRAGKEKAEGASEESQEGYLVSAVLGLLALLLGFTFAMAVDRFEQRRTLVLDEANAISTAYLRTQLLQAPHRERIGKLLTEYTENRLALSHAKPRNVAQAIEINDRLLTDLWTATVAAFPTIKGMDFSSAYLDSMKELINLDAARKAAFLVRVPTTVYGVLLIYMIVTAWVMGYVLVGFRGQVSAVFVLVLLVLSLALIVDIDRPAVGPIQSSHAPIEAALKAIKSQPPAIYDRWLEAPTP